MFFFQFDSFAGVYSWCPAVQLQGEVGEGQVEVEMEASLPLLPTHPHTFQGESHSYTVQGESARQGVFLLFLIQGTLLICQSSRMLGMNIRVTACEATFESLLQLSLQLFIIFLRSNTMPSVLQVSDIT